jgi:tRNA G37 N-methylase Trm5
MAETKPKKQWYDNKELFEKFSCMFARLEKELVKTQNDVKQYNGLVSKLINAEERLSQIQTMLADQIKRCDTVQLEKEQCAAIDEATYELREQLIAMGKAEERDRFERAIKIIGAVVLVLTTATGLITWFFNLWRF